ncbi:MAG: sulfatase [Tepidisphaeraceae bacterium]
MGHWRALLALCVALFLCAPALAAQRNVLLIIADDMGLDGGCFGNDAVATPNLDRLASEGTRFANAFATVSSCSPSRAVLLTGLYTHQNGQYGLAHAEHKQSTRDDVQSLPKLLGQRGYRTAIVGKNHVTPETVYNYAATLKPQPPRSVTGMSVAAGDFLAGRDERPFFLVVGFTEPHRAKVGFGNDTNAASKPTRAYDPAKLRVPPFLPDDPAVRADLAEYYKAIDRLDQGVGQLLDQLDRSGRRDDTLVIFLSDNGMPFPGAKTNLYDAGIRLPLIVRVPGTKPGIVSRAMVSWIDVAPTVLEFAGAAAPKTLPGRSILPIVEQDDAPDRDVVFASHVMHEVTMYYPMRAIRTRTHKLIWNLTGPLPYPIAGDIFRSPSWRAILKTGDMGGRTRDGYLHRPEFELYDLAKDPNELKNVAADAAYAEVLADLKSHLMKQLAETNDPWLGPDRTREE